MYDEEARKEDFERSMEEQGVNPKQILDDIERIVADIYQKEGRKPTRGEVMAALINEYNYENYEAEEEAVSYATRGMM